MNPQDYTPQEDTQSTKEWFDSISTTSNNTTATASQTPPTSRKSKKPLIISLCVLLVAGLVTSGMYFYYTRSTLPKKCLDMALYKELTNVNTTDPIDAKDNFYTESIEFTTGSSEYSDSSKQITQDFMHSVGSLYQRHNQSTSIVVTISTSYTDKEEISVATKRLQNIKSSLLKVGVEESAMKIQEPIYTLSEEGTELNNTPARITITSAETCTQ